MRAVRHWLTIVIAVGFALPAHAGGLEDGVKKWRAGDYAGAVAEWKTPAAAGNRDAQFNLGQAYKLGRGVPADPQKAIEYYRKAAAQGHPAAEANLGWVLFQTGKRDEALPLLQRAAGRGDAHSQYLLGVAYFNGDVVPRDWPRAYRLMSAAAGSGLPQARDALNAMEARMPLADRQRALAAGQMPSASPSAPTTAPAATPPASVPPASSPQNTPENIRGWRVQLGAFSNQKAAATAWTSLSARFPELKSLSPDYVPSNQMIRLQAGPLSGRAAASGLCAKLTSAGAGCFPISP
jgi:cell division septation protein DedD